MKREIEEVFDPVFECTRRFYDIRYELFARSNAIRDVHLANVIYDLVNRGHRVFAIAGSSHAVKLDAALHGLLDEAHHSNARE